MNYDELISNANLAFAGNNFKLALENSLLAIKKDSSKSEGFICAGKAALSLDKITDAVKLLLCQVSVHLKVNKSSK